MAQMVSPTGFRFAHKGFNIVAHNAETPPTDLKNTVDDFMDSIVPMTTPDEGIKRIDTARIAMAHSAACIMLMPPRKVQNFGHPAHTVFAPNRIQRKHLTTDSRLRNLMHGGILGVLARRLTLDPTQLRQWNQPKNALCIVRSANNSAGCAHVKWSIPEFQYTFNIGIKMYRTGQTPLNELSGADLFSLLDTAENRNTFLAECRTLANGVNQSRVVYPMETNANNGTVVWKAHRPVFVENVWIMDFMAAFTKTCSEKMAAVNNSDAITTERSTNLVDLYRFVTRIDWILNDLNMRCVLNLNRFYEAHIKRLIYMGGEGIEHSAYMLGRNYPEMMTPELHMQVVPNPKHYMVPEMLVMPDDDVFGPMKVACQGFMPEPVPLPVRRRLYSDSDSYSDGTDDTSDVHDYMQNEDDDNYDYDNEDG